MHVPQTRMSYLFIDTETTGLPLQRNAHYTALHVWPRIVSISWAFYATRDSEPIFKYKIIRPDNFIVPEDASKIHGISTERAIAEGVELSSALREFTADVLAHPPTLLVAHNMQFDRPVILAEFLRMGIKEPISTIPTFCTMLSTTELCRILPMRYGQYKWPKLTELHYHLFQMEFSAGHDARADVRACAKCFFRLQELGYIKF